MLSGHTSLAFTLSGSPPMTCWLLESNRSLEFQRCVLLRTKHQNISFTNITTHHICQTITEWEVIKDLGVGPCFSKILIFILKVIIVQ